MHLPANALESLSHLEDRIANAPHLLVFVDYDGTLAPLTEHPAQAQLDADVRQTLRTLVERPNTTLVVLGGRSLEDLQHLVGVDEAIYAANHGLEIAGPDFCFVSNVPPGLQSELVDMLNGLSARLGEFPGAWIEDKWLTLTVHLRRVPEARRGEVEAIVRDELARHGADLLCTPGQAVLEIRPPVLWDKGTACHWIRKKFAYLQPLSIYLGDDRTDEEAFCVLDDAITVKVGNQLEPTAARYGLAGPEEVREFLHWLTRAANTDAELVGTVWAP
jgi:trehalose 6-phosphate phosphatase